MGELAWERAFRERCLGRGMRWESVRYRRPGGEGETVAHRIRPAGEPRAVALAVHGAGNDALFGWVALFERLLGAGLEVFTFDLEGHGRASTTRFTAAGAAASLAEAAARSGAAERGLPLHAVGISLGGAVLLHALPRLEGVASAALMATPLRIRFGPAAVRAEVGRALLRALWRGRALYGLTGLIPSFGPYKRSVYPLRLAEAPGPGAFGYVQALDAALERLELERAAREVRVPTLLVYGGRDRLVPPEQGERLARLIPDAELLLLPRETHLTAPLSAEAVDAVARWFA